jgi:hypothetical protein
MGVSEGDLLLTKKLLGLCINFRVKGKKRKQQQQNKGKGIKGKITDHQGKCTPQL